MSINNNPGCIEGMAQNHIGGFSPHARKPGQFLHRGRHFTAEFFHQLPRAFFQRFGLGAKKAKRANELLDLCRPARTPPFSLKSPLGDCRKKPSCQPAVNGAEGGSGVSVSIADSERLENC